MRAKLSTWFNKVLIDFEMGLINQPSYDNTLALLGIMCTTVGFVTMLAPDSIIAACIAMASGMLLFVMLLKRQSILCSQHKNRWLLLMMVTMVLAFTMVAYNIYTIGVA